MNLTSGQKLSASVTASKLGIPLDWLLALVSHESGGNPQAKNPISSARGLIQFLDSVAKELGYTSSLDLVVKNPTFESQMSGPVYKYLAKYGPYSSFAEICGAVFYPLMRHNVDAPLPAQVQAKNPFKTIREYANRAWSRYKGIPITPTAEGIGLGVFALLALAYWQRKGLAKAIRLE